MDGNTQMREVLRVQALNKHVMFAGSALPILREIEFSVAAGETLAIIGASGSGKSTLLGLLAGLDLPSSGEISLCGEPLSRMDEDARASLRAKRVGFVFQQFQLLPAMTALENVMLPLELAGADAASTRAKQILERVGLGARLSHYPRQLSGGEQQRVALARAFVGHPEILFADEPTGSLDRATGQQVSDLMFEMNAQLGTTLILVTHEESLARRCQRQLRLDSGSVVSGVLA